VIAAETSSEERPRKMKKRDAERVPGSIRIEEGNFGDGGKGREDGEIKVAKGKRAHAGDGGVERKKKRHYPKRKG